MLPLAILRWLAFAVYFVGCAALPLVLLWGFPGLIGGTALGGLLLSMLRIQGVKGLTIHRQSKPLTPAQAPVEYRLTQEYCRRLGLPVPALRVLESPSLNMAIYGFHSQDRQLVLTRGILQTLSRPQKSALIALALCHAARGEVANRTWLASFFDFIQTLLLPFPGRRLTRSASVPLHRVFRQLVLYPLSLFPAFVLGTSEKSAGVDALAIRVTQNPRALAEAFRRVEASSERTPLQTPFSARHLFLTPSPSADPLIRLFFSTSSFENRVHAVETALGRTPA